MMKSVSLVLATAAFVSHAELEKAVLNTSGCLGGEEMTYSTDQLTVNITSSPLLGFIHGKDKYEAGTTIALNYSGNNVLQCSSGFTWNATAIFFDIDADTTAQTAWCNTLLHSKKTAAITLIDGGAQFSLTAASPIDATLLGQGAGGMLTLGGGYSAQFTGFFTSLAAAQQSFTGGNQLAVVGSAEDGRLSLVSKLNRTTTPEPATATLSLLALTALCTRRRR